MPDLLSRDIAGTQPGAFTLDPAQNLQQAQDVSQQQAEQAVQRIQPQQPVAAPTPDPNATVSEQAAPPATPVDTQVTQAATYITTSFNKFLASGGDASALTKEDLDAVAAAANTLPKIDHPETDQARMYGLYTAHQLGNATGLSPGIIGDVFNAVGGLLNNVWKAGSEYVTSENPFRPGGWGAVVESKQKQSTAMLMGMRQAWDNTTNLLPHGALDVLLGTYNAAVQNGTINPDQKARLDLAQSEIIRQRMWRETSNQRVTTDVRDLISNAYKSVGLNSAAAAVASVKPDDPMVQTSAAIFDPSNELAGFAGELIGKGTGAVKAMRAGVRTQALTEASVALSDINDRVAAAGLARTHAVGALSDTTLSDASRSKLQSDLARLKTVQSNLETERQATEAAHAAALEEVRKQTVFMTDADPARGAAGAVTQAGGAAVGVLGKVQDLYDAFPDTLAKKILPEGAEAAQARVADVLRRVQSGAAAALIGAATGPMGAGIAAGAGFLGSPLVEAFLKGGLTKAAHNLSAIGEQLAMGPSTIPLMRRVAESTEGLTSIVASKLDNASIAPLLTDTKTLITHVGTGMTIGGVAGYLQSGGDPRAAAEGAGTAGFFGMVGGLGQLGHYNSLPELRQARVGDRGRFLKALSPQDGKLFNALHPEYQLAIGSYAIAHPDLDIHFFADKNGTNGKWSANTPKGRVDINVMGDNPMHAILAHEIGHHIAAHELGDSVDAYTRGNPITGQPGLTTQLDADGKPMLQKDPITGQESFVQNAQFEKYKADYNARLLKDNPGMPPADDYTIAQEIFADLHAHYIENPELLQKAVRGHVPSDIVSESMLTNFLHKSGFGTDAITGNPIASSNLKGAQALQDIVKNYYKERQYKKQSITDGPQADGDRSGARIPVGDIVKGTDEFDRLVKNLPDTGDFHRNPDGSIKVDAAGRPLVKTPKEANADHAKLAEHVISIYQNQPGLTGPHNPNGLRLVTDRPTTPGGQGRTLLRGQVVPDSVFDELSASNQYNANQILNWRKMNGIMTRDDGTVTNAVYNTATTRKGRYATLAAREREMVPLYTEISPKTKQINIQMYDPEQMVKNVTRMMKTKNGKKIYGNDIGPAYDDVRTYLDNLVNNRPGETGIGMEKKGVINEMFGINAEANPFVSDVMKGPRSASVWKTMRLDRINRVVELRDTRDVRSDTYEKVRGFMQPRGGKAAAPLPAETFDEHTLPVTTRLINGKEKPEKYDYGITESPLVADKQPPLIPKGKKGEAFPNDYGHVKFLSEPDQKRQTHLDRAGAVSAFADKLVQEYGKHADNPDVMKAKDWYDMVLGHLKTGFGKHAEIFGHLLAATSPQQGVIQNWHDARVAWEQWRRGAYDDAIKEYQRTGKITPEMQPRKPPTADNPQGALFGANSDEVLKVLAGTWLKEVKGPKTPNFFDNLFQRGVQATIDKWAARTMRRMGFEGVEGAPKRWRLQPKSESGVSNLDFAFSQAAFKQAAERLNMDPHQLQAILWYAEKHVWADRKWSKGGAAAAKESYIPMLAEYAKQRAAAGLVEHE